MLLISYSGLKKKCRQIAERSPLLIAAMNEVLVGPIGDRDADSHRRAKSSTGFEVGLGSVGGLHSSGLDNATNSTKHA